MRVKLVNICEHDLLRPLKGEEFDHFMGFGILPPLVLLLFFGCPIFKFESGCFTWTLPTSGTFGSKTFWVPKQLKGAQHIPPPPPTHWRGHAPWGHGAKDHMTKSLGKVPWVVFGGSYPGSLSAWARNLGR